MPKKVKLTKDDTIAELRKQIRDLKKQIALFDRDHSGRVGGSLPRKRK